MLRAQELGMMDGSYAFLTYWFSPERSLMEPWSDWEHEDNETMVYTLKKAMTSVKVVRVITKVELITHCLCVTINIIIKLNMIGLMR